MNDHLPQTGNKSCVENVLSPDSSFIVDSRIDFVSNIGAVGAVIGRSNSCRLALDCAVNTLSICIFRCHTRARAMVVSIPIDRDD